MKGKLQPQIGTEDEGAAAPKSGSRFVLTLKALV
jgi:hypothetical protein